MLTKIRSLCGESRGFSDMSGTGILAGRARHDVKSFVLPSLAWVGPRIVQVDETAVLVD